MRRIFKYETYLIDDSTGMPIVDFADITFVNIGTATISINGFPLATTQSLTDPAFGDERNGSNYRFSVVGAGTFILYARVKIYMN